MSETNQQQDELPAYLKDEPPAGTGSYADILKSDFTVIHSCNNQTFYLSTVLLNESFYTAVLCTSSC